MKSTKKSSSFVRLASPGSLIRQVILCCYYVLCAHFLRTDGYSVLIMSNCSCRFMDGISWVFLGLGLVGAVGTGNKNATRVFFQGAVSSIAAIIVT